MVGDAGPVVLPPFKETVGLVSSLPPSGLLLLPLGLETAASPKNGKHQIESHASF